MTTTVFIVAPFVLLCAFAAPHVQPTNWLAVDLPSVQWGTFLNSEPRAARAPPGARGRTCGAAAGGGRPGAAQVNAAGSAHPHSAATPEAPAATSPPQTPCTPAPPRAVMFWNLNYWDNVSCLAGEVDQPATTFPRALLWAVLLVVASYLAPTMAALGVMPEAGDWELGYYGKVAQQVGGGGVRRGRPGVGAGGEGVCAQVM